MHAYLGLHERISADDLKGTQHGFEQVMKSASVTKVRAPADAAKRWQQLRGQVEHSAHRGHQAKDLNEARVSFEAVSLGVIEVLRRYGNPTSEPVRLAHCPMAFDNKGAEWLQVANEIENPYFGSKMFRCGEVRGTAEPKGRLPEAKIEAAAAAPAGGHQH